MMPFEQVGFAPPAFLLPNDHLLRIEAIDARLAAMTGKTNVAAFFIFLKKIIVVLFLDDRPLGFPVI